jgi:acetylornithine aminotransferase
VVCAAALAVLRTVEQDGLLAAATTLGAQVRDGVHALAHPAVREVRGLGLWLGIVLTEPVAAHAEALLREHGFLVNAAAPDVLRLAPPLVVTAAQLEAFVDALPGVLDAACTATRVTA